MTSTISVSRLGSSTHSCSIIRSEVAVNAECRILRTSFTCSLISIDDRLFASDYAGPFSSPLRMAPKCVSCAVNHTSRHERTARCDNVLYQIIDTSRKMRYELTVLVTLTVHETHVWTRLKMNRWPQPLHRIPIDARRLLLQFKRCFLIAMSNPQCDHYRLVLASSSARRVFAEQSKRSVRLPRISIPRGTRAAEQIQAVLEAKWGWKAVVIDFLGDSPGRDSIVIAELRDRHRVSSLPHAHSWVRLSDIPECDISASERLIVGRL